MLGKVNAKLLAKYKFIKLFYKVRVQISVFMLGFCLKLGRKAITKNIYI